MIDPLELLARQDKWYLSGGDGILFAPTFPLWLDAPGFWDEGTIFQYAFGPLFTVSALDAEGREIPMRAISRRWTPADLTVQYRLTNGMTAIEVRSVQPGGVFASEWRLQAMRPSPLHLVAWTAQDGPSVDVASARWDDEIRFTRTLLDRRDVPMRVTAQLSCSGGATSWAASMSEASASQPHWRFTPFVEKWRADGLPREIRLEGISASGLVYAAVHKAIHVGSDGASATFAMRLSPAQSALAHTRGKLSAPEASTLAGTSRQRWRERFARVPEFRCSDPYLERYYWYRWYGLWLNALEPGVGNYSHPGMCEGVGFFHQPITYSAQCHARELRWLSDPEHARGIFRTFFTHQKSDGSLHGRIYVNHLSGTDFYHANWGDALLALDAVWPDDAFLREMYLPLSRYARWLVVTRDPSRSGMFDVVDQYETGQEFMSRYQAVDPQADRYVWENRLRLKGIDVTVYAYALFRALARMAPRAGAEADVEGWKSLAARTEEAVRGPMWDAEEGMFFDVNPSTGRRTGVKAAVCFYPYFTDLADETHIEGLERHLLDPSQFWTTFPVPSSSVDDPLFDAFAEWKGKRHVCPWNGRVWPMTNSHIVEALAHASRLQSPQLRNAAAQLLHRFIRMMFHDGDLDRPNCYEHYHPFTGHASVYRGIDDYQHSWVSDLIISYIMGVRPHDRGVTIDPYPFGLSYAEITGVRVRGKTVDVFVEGERMTVRIDGETRPWPMGIPMELAW